MDIAKKWNEKYRHMSMPKPNERLCKWLYKVDGKRALDLACGMGQNALLLAAFGFEVDAIDISKEGLKHIQNIPSINPICTDIKSFQLSQNYYDFIIVTNFLERSIFKKLKEALRDGGNIFYETFTYKKENFNPNYALEPNELLKVFCDFEIISYELLSNKAAILAQKSRYIKV